MSFFGKIGGGLKKLGGGLKKAGSYTVEQSKRLGDNVAGLVKRAAEVKTGKGALADLFFRVTLTGLSISIGLGYVLLTSPNSPPAYLFVDQADCAIYLYSYKNKNGCVDSSIACVHKSCRNALPECSNYTWVTKKSTCNASTNTYTPKNQTQENDRCSLFDSSEIKMVFLNIPKGSNSLTMYFKIPGGVPGLEKYIPGDSSNWKYSAKIGDIESQTCSFQGYSERLYCKFIIPQEYANSTKAVSLKVNGCSHNIYSHASASIPKPVAVANPEGEGDSSSKTYCEQLLEQGDSGFYAISSSECAEAGGSYEPSSLSGGWCNCE
jgi:hypothetical protein